MDKIKKDFIVIYLARNLLATFAITVFSFVYDITCLLYTSDAADE